MATSKIQTGLRINEATYNKLKTIAKSENRPLNNLMEFILIRYLADYEAKHGPVAEYEE